MGADDTTLRISRETWRRLNDRKEPGKLFDDIITELLDGDESCDESQSGATATN